MIKVYQHTPRRIREMLSRAVHFKLLEKTDQERPTYILGSTNTAHPKEADFGRRLIWTFAPGLNEFTSDPIHAPYAQLSAITEDHSTLLYAELLIWKYRVGHGHPGSQFGRIPVELENPFTKDVLYPINDEVSRRMNPQYMATRTRAHTQGPIETGLQL